jgi:helicase
VERREIRMLKKPMKMRSLEEYGIPSYIIDIWEKNYSP